MSEECCLWCSLDCNCRECRIRLRDTTFGGWWYYSDLDEPLKNSSKEANKQEKIEQPKHCDTEPQQKIIIVTN